MNPQQNFGFPSLQQLQQNRRFPRSTDPSPQAVGDIQAALSLRGDQASINLLLGQPSMTHGTGLAAAGLPALDLAALQRAVSLDEGNRQRLYLEAQLDLLSRSNTGIFPNSLMQNNSTSSSYPKQQGYLGPAVGGESYDGTPEAKKRKLSSSDMPHVSADTVARKRRSSISARTFPLPARSERSMVSIRGAKSLDSYLPAWKALNNNSSRLDGSVSAEERYVMVREAFGKVIQQDRALLYHSKYRKR